MYATKLARCNNFVDKKTGEEVANRLMSIMEESTLNSQNCVAAAFDNARSMSGQKRGVQAQLKKNISSLTFVPCGNHSLSR